MPTFHETEAAHAVALQLELVAGLRRTPSTLSRREWLTVLRSLHAVDARVVVLRVLFGLTTAAIGERLDVTGITVMSRWRRACRSLDTPTVHRMLEVS